MHVCVTECMIIINMSPTCPLFRGFTAYYYSKRIVLDIGCAKDNSRFCFQDIVDPGFIEQLQGVLNGLCQNSNGDCSKSECREAVASVSYIVCDCMHVCVCVYVTVCDYTSMHMHTQIQKKKLTHTQSDMNAHTMS